MKHMGVNEELHRASFLELFRKVLDNSITDAQIDWYYANGRISTDDVERLKNYDTKFEREQKAILQKKAKDLQLLMRELNIPGKDKRLYEDLALNDFYNNTRLLDTHASNFSEAVQREFSAAITGAISALKGRFKTEDFWGNPNSFGKRILEVVNKLEQSTTVQTRPEILYQPMEGQEVVLSPQGDTSGFSNVIHIPDTPQLVQDNTPQARDYSYSMQDWANPYPQPRTQNTIVPTVQEDTEDFSIPTTEQQTITPTRQLGTRPEGNLFRRVQFPTYASDDVLRDIVGGDYRITSEYSATPTKLREGRGHLALDLGLKENTPLYAPKSINFWTVSNTGNNSKAGNFITLEAKVYGDTYSLTLAHLNSIEVSKGDSVLAGSVVAKSGNTGNSTGPHVHISVKKNGENIDPRSFRFDKNPVPVSAPQPQPLVQPVVSSDVEASRTINAILFGDFSLSGDNLFAPSFGRNSSFDINYGGY